MQGGDVTEDYQLWAHGFAVTATLYHCRTVLGALAIARQATLLRDIPANAGHVAVMLRTLSTIGWVVRAPSADGNVTYSTTPGVAACAASPTVAALCEDVYSDAAGSERKDVAWGSQLPRLAKWLSSIEHGWALPAEASTVPHLATMLAGAVIAPMLLELRMMSSAYTAKADEGAHEHASSRVSLASLDGTTARAIGQFFTSRRWGSFEAASSELRLSESGLFIVERCPAFGVCLSYRPMLHRLSEASFGATASVFRYEGGHEAWVDRKLNVIGSGFMHNRYFADMMSVCVKTIFDAMPLEQQPRVIADMGCGDGTLLKTIYLYVKSETRRGRHLDEYPLTVCGVDFNDDSLKETGLTLTAAGVPHGVMTGDIGDPIPMQQQLEAQFGVSREQVLHVRSFLDHDRPFIPPSRPADELIERAINSASDAAYVSNSDGGRLVTPSEAFHSLVEHWERWAACLGQHGLLVLEVSNLDVASTRKHMRQATSMHFDALQAHSGQMLMPATQTAIAAATAGLLPATDDVLTYPKDAPYTRIVLQHLRRAHYSIRLATLHDLPAMLELETHWRSDVLAAAEATLHRRVSAHPTGQYLAVAADGQLLGAMYTQRVASYATLLTAVRETELELHTPSGPVTQLLGVVQRPGAESAGVGDGLRRFALLLGRLDATVERACGVTRCRAYDPSSALVDYQAHVDEGTDPGLLFHTTAGARVGELVPGYRPRDTANLGYGVMISYELGAHSSNVCASTAGAAAPTHNGQPRASSHRVMHLGEATCLVCEAIDNLHYGAGRTEWSQPRLETALLDLGLDSLDIQQLVAKLNVRLAANDSPVRVTGQGVLEHPTPLGIAALVCGEVARTTPPPRSSMISSGSAQQAGARGMPLALTGGLSLIFEGIGQPPDGALHELLTSAQVDPVASELVAEIRDALQQAAGALLGDRCPAVGRVTSFQASAWDHGHPAVQLPVCVALHLLAVHRLVSDSVRAEGGGDGWARLSTVLVSATGHSVGFLSAALLVSGAATACDFRRRSKLAMRVLVKLGELIARGFPACNDPQAASCTYVLRDTGVEVGEIQCAASRFDGVSVALVNSPSSAVVAGHAAVLTPFIRECAERGWRAVPLPIRFPVHCPLVSEVRKELAESDVFGALLHFGESNHGDLHGDRLGGVSLISPLDGSRVASDTLADAVLDCLTVGVIEWPKALAALDEVLGDEVCDAVLHVGSAGVSAWYDFEHSRRATFLEICVKRGRHVYGPWPQLQPRRTSGQVDLAGSPALVVEQLERLLAEGAPGLELVGKHGRQRMMSSSRSLQHRVKEGIGGKGVLPTDPQGRLGSVLRKVYEVTGIDAQPTQVLRDLGLDSISTGRLVHELRDLLPLSSTELFGERTIADLVMAAYGDDGDRRPTAGTEAEVSLAGRRVSFALFDALRMPLALLVMLYHLHVRDSSTVGALFAVNFFFCASYVFWQMSYPHGQPLYGRAVRRWVWLRLCATLPMYYIVLPVQQLLWLRKIVQSPVEVRRELLNWLCAGPIVGNWTRGDEVIWFLACQAWLIVVFPVVVAALRLDSETTWAKVALLAVLCLTVDPLLVHGFGVPRYLNHGHLVWQLPVMALCVTVTADLCSPAPLLRGGAHGCLRGRRRVQDVALSLYLAWLVSELSWLNVEDAYALQPYARPLAAVGVPFLLWPSSVFAGFEWLIRSPAGQLLVALAPYSLSFYSWQAVPVRLVVTTAPADPSDIGLFGEGAGDGVVPEEVYPWLAVPFKVAILAAIAFCSRELLEAPAQAFLKRALDGGRPGRGETWGRGTVTDMHMV